jgi:hypothetical protein
MTDKMKATDKMADKMKVADRMKATKKQKLSKEAIDLVKQFGNALTVLILFVVLTLLVAALISSIVFSSFSL